MSLYQKLALFQSEVKGLGKDKDGFGYKYVTGSKVLEHIKPLMVKHSVILKQEIISIENERQDYSIPAKGQNPAKEKSEILSKVMMKFTWIDCETGEKDENLFGANGQNDWDKGVGSALTYGERYFLLKFFHINTDEDDIDNPERKQEEQTKADLIAENKRIEDERRLEIQKTLDSAGTVEELGKEYTNLSTSDKVLFKDYTNTLKAKLIPKN